MIRKSEVRIWLVVVFGLLALLLWGGLADEDPLSPYVADDAVRHLLGFSTLGFVAAFVRQILFRAAAMVSVLGFAVAFEVLQGPFSPREASWEDLAASATGAFAGFGLGQFLISAVGGVRQLIANRK